MAYGHESHHGLGITHLHDKQGFLCILALMKFSMQPGITGELLNCSHKAIQVELGLPGEMFQYPYKDWGQSITPCWLGHTWQYLLELGIQLDTHKMTLQAACNKDSFLMLNFWNVGYWGEALLWLNKCHIWLQVTMAADITDGQEQHILNTSLEGMRTIAQPNWWHWPKQGQPLGSLWDLWCQALNKTIPCIDQTTLIYPLELWTDSITLWKWCWNLEEEWLAEKSQGKWCIWIPIQCN